MYIPILNQAMLVLSDLEAARDLFDRRGSIYSDRPRFVLLSDLWVKRSKYQICSLLINPVPAEWAGITLQPMSASKSPTLPQRCSLFTCLQRPEVQKTQEIYSTDFQFARGKSLPSPPTAGNGDITRRVGPRTSTICSTFPKVSFSSS
jgi:hypothetical protein